jgi:hypothetical protein
MPISEALSLAIAQLVPQRSSLASGVLFYGERTQWALDAAILLVRNLVLSPCMRACHECNS